MPEVVGKRSCFSLSRQLHVSRLRRLWPWSWEIRRCSLCLYASYIWQISVCAVQFDSADHYQRFSPFLVNSKWVAIMVSRGPQTSSKFRPSHKLLQSGLKRCSLEQRQSDLQRHKECCCHTWSSLLLITCFNRVNTACASAMKVLFARGADRQVLLVCQKLCDFLYGCCVKISQSMQVEAALHGTDLFCYARTEWLHYGAKIFHLSDPDEIQLPKYALLQLHSIMNT